MTDIRTQFPSKSLKSSDIGNRRIRYTIKGVGKADFDDGESKPTVEFHETEQNLVLNKTNANRIGEMHGWDTDLWPGKQIVLYVEKVDFQGRMVDGIRVEVQQPERPPVEDAAPTPQTGIIQEPDDGTVPF